MIWRLLVPPVGASDFPVDVLVVSIFADLFVSDS